MACMYTLSICKFHYYIAHVIPTAGGGHLYHAQELESYYTPRQSLSSIVLRYGIMTMAAIGDGSGTKTGLAEGNDTNVEDDGHSKDLDLEYNNYIVLSLFFQVAFFLL
nr:uncharacterized protein LOC104644865 [Solanum lycopersicum]